MTAKQRRGKGKIKTHEGDIAYLIEFVGEDLLMQLRRFSKVTCEREELVVRGKILGGYFKLSVTFNGETKH